MTENIFLDKSNYVRIPVSQLKEGMFVAELDRPWLETPFLLQGFVIHKQAEIRKLQELCSHVYVEKAGSSWGGKRNPFQHSFGTTKRASHGQDSSGLRVNANKTDKSRSLVSSIASRTEHKVNVRVAEEHSFARTTYKHAKQTTVEILEQARLGNALDTGSAKQVVNGCVESILRNPNALMWMAKIKHADDYTLEHCLNVCVLAISFGRHLRMDETRLERLGLCGLMHDVGKMQVPDAILNKPAELTDAEFKVMQSHTTRGRDLLLKEKDALAYTVDAAMNHHERIDGKGYPRGLFANELSDYARIVSIVDAFDAMTSERCYSKAKSTLDALKEIYRGRGAHFDDDLALEFIQLIGPYPPGTIVELKNGYIGIVLSSKVKKRHMPFVKIVLDQQKQPQEPEVVDLLDVERGSLGKEFLIARVLKDGDYDVFLENYPVQSTLQSLASSAPVDDRDVKDSGSTD
ncbi:MAG: HD-GYP domain-containing protein [Porticoccaceae bacterium]|nr:HD-GYP domain-containing protein [Pseudomonadales bacterium]MCP5172455.1 HD-GYP domain-containing protein [Pseudomonadales bacterium]